MSRLSSWDVPGSLVAGLLIGADVVLRMTGHDAATFDATIPVITALYLGGRVATVAVHAAQSNGTAASTGPSPASPPAPTVTSATHLSA